MLKYVVLSSCVLHILCSRLQLEGLFVPREDKVHTRTLFGKPFLSMNAPKANQFTDPEWNSLAFQILQLLNINDSADLILEALRATEWALYKYFVQKPHNSSANFCKVLFPCPKYKFVIDANSSKKHFNMRSQIIGLDGGKYFSIMKLYYEMLMSLGRCQKWVPFDASVPDWPISTGPFAILPKDVIQNIVSIIIQDYTPNQVKNLSLICKRFHSLDLLSVALRTLDSKSAARLLILTYSSPFETRSSCHISNWYFTKEWIFKTCKNDELLVALLQERSCTFEPIMPNIVFYNAQTHLVPRMTSTPTRLALFLQSMTFLIKSISENVFLRETLRVVFNAPSFWEFMRDEERGENVKKAAAKIMKSLQGSPFYLSHSVRDRLTECEFDSSFEQFLPLFK